MRDYRERRRANGGKRLTAPVVPESPSESTIEDAPPCSDPARAVEQWSAKRLRVPPGHANAGEPMLLPAYFVDFLRDALADGVREAGCYVARKNAKSACVAALVLAHLANDGPLRRRGWRAGIASVSKDKATELWQQIEDIAAASELDEIRCGKVPRHVASEFGRVDILAADKSAGHASGFDLAIADELGLFPDKGRDLVSGLITSTSARDGRLLAISVIGDSPLSREMIDRRADPATVVHVHQAPKDCALDDESAWRAANPALGSVKSETYMRDMSRRAAANPSEQAAFRAFDLNLPGRGTKETIVPVGAWTPLAVLPRPERAGPCFLGIDLGGSTSMTAAALYFAETGRLECYGAFGEIPDLSARGETDGVGDRYVRMQERGELRTFPGRVTPVTDFLRWIVELLAGEAPALVLADRYRQEEAIDALHGAGCGWWPMEWRAQGSGKDGSADVRAFQRAVHGGKLRPGESLLLESAIVESVIRYDGNGNPALDKGRAKGRIDALAAAVLAVGAGDRAMARLEGDNGFYFARIA